MNLDNPVFVIPLVAGATLVVAGLMMLKLPSKKVNRIYGYRTADSMKSQGRWSFSQKYAAKELIRFGILAALSSVLGLFYHPEEEVGVAVGLATLLLAIIFPIVRTERALKKKFGKENDISSHDS